MEMSSKNDGRGARRTCTAQEALLFHSQGRPGKLELVATKPMATQRDLPRAYSPGVAVPVLAIAEDEDRALDYTAKGNFVAVITNGTAILGLGNRGALAAKPVMEGKAVLFKRFADIDSIDLEVSSEDTDEIVNCVKLLGKSWGGINLEDIRAPECFIIEQRLRELLDIPVFHDDQHGTAIIAAAGLMNALDLTGRDIKSTNLVCNRPPPAPIPLLDIGRRASCERAPPINVEIKVAAAHALAALGREGVADEVAVAYGARPQFGRQYIIPVPFDPRLISFVPPAIAKAAMDTGVARRPIVDMDAYRAQLRSRRDPIAGFLQRVYDRLRRRPQRVVFAEGEEEQVIRAAMSFVVQGLGSALLVGREDRVRDSARSLGIERGG